MGSSGQWTTWHPSRPRPSVDQRADIYALGLILRDMITGRSGRPRPDNPLGDLMQRLATSSPPVRAVAAEVPEPVERILTRCLRIEPVARFPNTAALEAALAELDDSGNVKPGTEAAPNASRPPVRTPLTVWLTRAAVP